MENQSHRIIAHLHLSGVELYLTGPEDGIEYGFRVMMSWDPDDIEYWSITKNLTGRGYVQEIRYMKKGELRINHIY